ncbi:MAG: spore maturation protein [Oscillospiraceae bacterium]|nr:spore maturation protein [Oscillospiraceae bacterium]
MSELIVPLILCGVGAFALVRRCDLYPALVRGAAEGLTTAKKILPPVVVLLSAVYLFRASGAMDVLVRLLSPILTPLGIPPECAPLLLIRPLSGSAALAAGADIIATYGVDSLIGRTAAVMLGSSETTFYVISVYFGSLGIKKTGSAVPAALFSDFIGALAAALTTRLF